MLTATQKELLKKLTQHKSLQLYQGGYWSKSDLVINENPQPDEFEFYFSSVTVNALIVMGAVKVAESISKDGMSFPTKIRPKDCL